MQTAWRERNPVARIKAARTALEQNPDCAPAYILLAEEEATTIVEIEKILKQVPGFFIIAFLLDGKNTNLIFFIYFF